MLNNIYFTIALMIIIAYVVMIVFLYFMQERLIFQGAYMFKEMVKSHRYVASDVNEFSFTTSDNINLHGAISLKSSDTLLIYFGGNAENVTNFVSMVGKLDHCDVVSLNYRGYDKSEGIPNENIIYSDALEIYKHFKDKYTYIIPVGKSLGCSVAAYLSANKQTKGTIFITPFDSVTNIAKSIYPFIPIEFLLKYPFDTHKFVSKVDTPISILIAGKDEVVPQKNTENLTKNIKNPLLITTLEDKTHNSIVNDENFLDFILNSIEKTTKKK